MNYYEFHITMIGDPTTIKKHVEDAGWKFSAIDGDPSLGDGVKCYATSHMNSKKSAEQALEHLQNTAGVLRSKGCVIVREKIELVIYDTRSKSVGIKD